MRVDKVLVFAQTIVINMCLFNNEFLVNINIGKGMM